MKNRTLKYACKFIVAAIFMYGLISYIVHGFCLYQRQTLHPRSIVYSKNNGIFIDSFLSKNTNQFEIWRSELLYLDYYGWGGLYCYKHTDPEGCYLLVRNKFNRDNFFFKTKYDDPHMLGHDITFGANNVIIPKDADSTYLLIYKQPTDLKSIYLYDSLNICW